MMAGAGARVFLVVGDADAGRRLAQSGHCCVLLLGEGQDGLVRRFSGPAPDLAGLSWQPAPSGAPVLQGAACWLDCEVTQAVEDRRVQFRSVGLHGNLEARITSGDSGL